MNTEFQNLPNIVSPKEVQTYFGISRSTTYRIFHDARSISLWAAPGVINKTRAQAMAAPSAARQPGTSGRPSAKIG